MANWQKTKAFFKGLTAVLTFLATIAGLTAFISLHLSVQQFEEQQQIARQEETERFVNLIGSLELEMEANLDVCKKLLANKEEYLQAISSPHNCFHYSILDRILATGEITDRRLREVMPDKVTADIATERKFRVTLFNAYHRMMQLNNLIEHSLDIMHLPVLVKTDAQINAQTSYRLKGNMGFLVSDTEYVRDQLLACLPAVKELKEHYAKELDEGRTQPEN